MRTEAQRRAELKRASKRVVVTFSINREVMPEHAEKLEASKGKKEFNQAFYDWLLTR